MVNIQTTQPPELQKIVVNGKSEWMMKKRFPTLSWLYTERKSHRDIKKSYHAL